MERAVSFSLLLYFCLSDNRDLRFHIAFFSSSLFLFTYSLS
jgi:hypothetical protein